MNTASISASVALSWPRPWLARVTISNKARMNAMTCAMWEQLPPVFEAIAKTPQARVVELVGDADGLSFCAGGDISEYASFRFQEDTLAYFHEQQVWPGLRAILACDLPVVAHINGTCMGAGLEMASCADIRIASSAAMFGAPIAKLGFPMAPKEAAVVAHAVGDAVVRNILLQAASYSATQLHHTGFLAQVCADAELAAAVDKAVQRLSALSPQAARLNKKGLRALWPQALQQAVGVAQSVGSAYAYANSEQHREGIAAFLAKRPAQF
ncbi:enoyl-CoA hydratase-related protein [Comamonadaceae bacterium M7527]|nr:enoyl-CoA hydratase-related protein [Comamonadaceae bacterium M7527]